MNDVYYFSGDNILPLCQKRYVGQWGSNVEEHDPKFLVSALTSKTLVGKHALRKAKRRERMHLKFLRCYQTV
ncbi:hypothetical protein [Phyllobacterium zundukense]|jgi:hypothetical protein|uniref:Uncharacterized protein n=1 Tax=Phyllobacterium zundukense TaxID=1867719 RepID=A0ACD4D5J6_9HYPH|nr:hypothetical protein [Phyllobacterium zundukense]UXN61125.1 hypothetical protein N8E88_13585 [Phyllobacterium zundukense]